MLTKTPTIRAHLPLVFVSLLMAAPLAGAARADTLLVPANQPTIQAAIVAAQPGDTVLVAPGRYVETIDFLGKAITVESSGGAAVTTIDGNGGGSVVSFTSGEPQGTLLRGFTITGGTGSTIPVPILFAGTLVGGGVKVLNSRPTLEDCIVVANTAANFGGGVFIHGDIGIASLGLVDCTIVSNTTTAPFGAGGGLYAYGGGIGLSRCTLDGNVSSGGGGGFAMATDFLASGGLAATECTISNNHAATGGGGASISLSNGFSNATLSRCKLSGNTALGGGGLSAHLAGDSPFAPSTLTLSSCQITGNVVQESGGGASVTTSIGFAFIDSSLFADNTASTGTGGGLRAQGVVVVTASTLARNSATSGGGLSLTGNSVRNSIVWGNVGGQIGGPHSVSWSDVQGGVAGVGNIDVDPFFVDAANGDYHLAPTSACVDAGDPSRLASGETDLDGDPRVLFGRIDIGADEATHPKGPWTFLGHSLAGVGSPPSLVGSGALTAGSATTLSLDGAPPGSASWLVAGAGQLLLPFKGGVMVPTIDMLIGPIGVGPTGAFDLTGRWPNGVPPGFAVALQTWIADPVGPDGFTASNGLAAESQ